MEKMISYRVQGIFSRVGPLSRREYVKAGKPFPQKIGGQMVKRFFITVSLLVGFQGLETFPTKLYAQPDTMWTKTYGGTSDDFGHSVQQCADNGFIISGHIHSFGAGLSDVYLIRVSSAGVEERDESSEFRVPSYELRVYPNPSTSGVRFQISDARFQNPDIQHLTSDISLKIYDLSGRLVKSFSLIPNPLSLTTAVEWDASDYPAGIYFLQFKAGDYKATKKLILVR